MFLCVFMCLCLCDLEERQQCVLENVADKWLLRGGRILLPRIRTDRDLRDT